ncbi:MAG: thiolase family protein [Planctomycetes bacterium]|nr:thiolase family protein [Planctomycetota bacterium]
MTPNSSPQVVVTHALRTPIGKYLGSFSKMSGVELATSVIRDLISREGVDPNLIGEVFLGNGRQAGAGPNPARQVSIGAGIPESVFATTVNMACGSGLKAMQLGQDAIRLGRARMVVAGGFESMSGLPFFLPKMRTGYRLGHDRVVDAMYQDGFECPLADMLMGATAEILAKEIGLTREQQDRFALESQQKAGAAQSEGRFKDEISPVEVTERRKTRIVSEDEHLRPSATMEGLGKLASVFDRENGTVTAGNASGITDGAAAVILMDAELAKELGITPMAIMGETCAAGVDPKRMGIGPVPAIRALEKANGIKVADYDLIELNEAFAAQVLACDHELKMPMERVNVNGGSIALGHPIGATGARIVVTLLHEMARRGSTNGLASLCISGGMGLATAFHRPSN